MKKFSAIIASIIALALPTSASAYSATAWIWCQPGQAGYATFYLGYKTQTTANATYYNYLTGGHWIKYAGTINCNNVFGCLGLGYAYIQPYPWSPQSIVATSNGPISLTKKWCQWFN